MYHHTDLTIIITCNYNNVGNNHNQHKSATVYLQYILKLIYLLYFTILYWFCHTSTWIRHGCTCVPHPESLSHLPPHTIPLGHPSAPAPSTLYHASNLDWRFISHVIISMFQHGNNFKMRTFLFGTCPIMGFLGANDMVLSLSYSSHS